MEIRDISRLLRKTNPTPGSVGPGEVDRDRSSREAGGSPDAVQVSERGRLLAELRRAAQAVPEVRSERVEEVRRGLASGKPELSPETIAQALLRHGVLRDLLGR